MFTAIFGWAVKIPSEGLPYPVFPFNAFLMRLEMYASPVVYPISLIPDPWKEVYNLNPMVGIIQGFRWAVFGGAAPAPEMLLLNGVMVLIVLWTGLVYFKRIEPLMPDII